MFDARQLLNQFLGSHAQPDATGIAATDSLKSFLDTRAGGLAGGALAGGLVALLTTTRTGRKFGKAALTYGGSALIGGLAYKAWSDWRAGKPLRRQAAANTSPLAALQPPPEGSAFVPQPENRGPFKRALIQAMITAAKADGQIDPTEQERIFRSVNELALDSEDKAFVMDQLAAPADMDAVVTAATCEETAAELYLASVLAIDPDGAAEQAYLRRLAARLELNPQLAAHLQATAMTAAAQAA